MIATTAATAATAQQRAHKFAQRKFVNQIASALALAAMAFGLFWLFWILLQTLVLGIEGLSWAALQQLKPDIISCHVTGFGLDGP